MKHVVWFFSICAVSLFSCQAVMKKMYGVKKPKIENEKSVKKTAIKYKLDTSNIATVTSAEVLTFLKTYSIPDAAIYDAQGNYIEYRQSDTSCNAGLFEFIPNLNLTNSYRKPGGLTLAEQLEKCRDLRGNKMNELESADFYILLFWTTWSGKLNKDHVKVWEDLAATNNTCKVKVLKINLDVQENWEPSEREMILNAFKQRRK